LVIDYGSQYTPLMDQPWMNNRISIDHKDDERLPGRVVRRAFRPQVDYLCVEQRIMRLREVPDWPARYGEERFAYMQNPLYDVPEHLWRRHLLYLHEFEAVVLLDDIAGPLPTDWSLQVLADSVGMNDAGAVFRGQLGVDLTVQFARPAQPSLHMTGYAHLGLDEPCQRHGFWPSWKWTVEAPRKITPMGESTVILRAEADPGQPYLVLLAAHRKEDRLPEIQTHSDRLGFRLVASAGEAEISVGANLDRWRIRLSTPAGREELKFEGTES
jgi:hypothetical protein